MIHALLLIDQEQGERTASWEALLAQVVASRHITITTTTTGDRLRRLNDFAVVIADTTSGPLSEDQEAALCAFVRKGGGLVCTGATGEAWQANCHIQELLGREPGRRVPGLELIARVADDHEITRRLNPTFVLHDSFYMMPTAPPAAEVLLEGRWQFSSIPLAYVRSCGAGRLFYTSLGCSADTLTNPVVQQILFRAIRYVAGQREHPPLHVAMIGYGAIGREHGTALQHTPGLEYTLVCDRSPARLEAATTLFPQLRTTTEISEVAADPAIGVVIVCTPPNTHADLARQMLHAGKHVVVEKPFCLTTAEADSLIALAQERDLALTVYQNRRWDPDFLAIQQSIADGLIGDVFHIETFIGGYTHPCDFWHSHEPVSGGVFFDWGSHYLDWVLTLLPDQVCTVRASSHKRVWHDVTNADQANLHIRFTGGQEATFIHSDIAAILKPKWYILGTKGAIVANWRYETVTTRKWSGDLIEEHLAPSEALPLVTVATRATGGQIHEQRLSLPPYPTYPFHRNLANHLLTGEPLAVNPISSRRNIAVMEAAVHSAAQNARTIELEC